MNSKISRKRKIILSVVFGLIYVLGASFLIAGSWYKETFDMSFSELLFVMLSPLAGTGEGTVQQIVEGCLLKAIIAILILVLVMLFIWKEKPFMHTVRCVAAVLSVALLVVSADYAVVAFRIPEYLEECYGNTVIYENYFTDPADVTVTAPAKAKNLICVYVESMETTYASEAVGGAQPENNYIPKLTALANENVSFSDKEGLGGFHSISGTGWTMGALLGTTSGIPFSIAIFGENSHNSLGKDGTFLNGAITLGDILDKNGYIQEFLLGSDASFAGQGTYLTRHGNYRLLDHIKAQEVGYIPEGYEAWWGFEDEKLFDIAKKEITNLAAEAKEAGKPFNFTMQTMDTHHVGGYRCRLCGNTYETKLENVLICSDTQIDNFINWVKAQEFYEDTVIIVLGDHPRMDTQLVSERSFYDRTVYNCFVNTGKDPESTKNRNFSSLDMFPTMLSALGFEIEGNRLGMGTDLFSGKSTLTEELGFDYVESELNKRSEYYRFKFLIDRE